MGMEWKRKGMRITNGNGNKITLNQRPGMGIGMNHWEWGNGIEKDIPVHL